MSTAGKKRHDEETPFRVVLVGLGRMGDMRLEELARRPDCQLAAIVDINH